MKPLPSLPLHGYSKEEIAQAYCENFAEDIQDMHNLRYELELLQERLSKFNHVCRPHQMPHPTETITIKKVRRRYKNKSGIYIGFHEATGQCMYVGLAKNLASRVTESRYEIHDCVIGIVLFDESDIGWAENYYIWYYKPHRNRCIKNSKLWTERKDYVQHNRL